MDEKTKEAAKRLLREGPGVRATRDDDSESLTFQVLELRRKGMSVRQIAAELGTTPSTVQGHLTKALTEVKTEPLEEVRELELQRLDEMLYSIQGRLATGDLRALETALRIQDRRAKYLGLDKQGDSPLPFGGAFTAALLIQQMKEGAGVEPVEVVAPSGAMDRERVLRVDPRQEWLQEDANRKRKGLEDHD